MGISGAAVQRVDESENLNKQRDLIELGKSEIAGQADAFNQIDSKTGVFLGFALVAIVQILNLLASKPPVGNTSSTVKVTGFVLAGGILIFIAAFTSIVGRWPRDFKDSPSLLDMESVPVAEFEVHLLQQTKGCIAHNKQVLEVKQGFMKTTAVLVLAAMLCLIVAGVIVC